MRGYTLARLLITVSVAFVVAGILYFTHPAWFESGSGFSLPSPPAVTATPGATAVKPRPKPKPTATVPRVTMMQHLDDVWITPYRVDRLPSGDGVLPNIGDQFLVVHMQIQNRSSIDYPVRLDDYEVLDSHGVLDPPLIENFTHQRLREVKLIPRGYIRGVLVFEVPLHDPAATLIYQPDPLDPTKRKEWQLQ